MRFALAVLLLALAPAQEQSLTVSAAISLSGALEEIARAYTTCQTQQAATSTYYFAMPRKQGGGLYLTKIIATGVEVPPTIERAIKELDAKVRGVITAALARL